MGKVMTTKQKCILSGLGGIAAGMCLVIGMENIISPTKRVSFTEREDMPRAIKVYNSLAAASKTFIEDPCDSKKYIPFSDYLERFKDKYQRDFERAKIRFGISQEEKEK